jgi:hypothetical protein
MAVLVEGISVIIKRKKIEEKFSGGWEAFVRDVPNSTLCADDELARVGFMSPEDVEAYVKHLEKQGFHYLMQGRPVDLVVGDQLHGPAAPCDWAQFGHVTLDRDSSRRVAACRASGSTLNMLIFPDGWQYEDSLSRKFGFAPADQPDKSLKFLRHENNLDVCLDPVSGKEVYVGRTAGRSESGLRYRKG